MILDFFFSSRIDFKYFDDKHIVITGASSGIGKSIATQLSTNSNCHLYLLARSFSSNQNEIKCDCSQYSQVKNAMLGKTIDIIIHCAGSGDWKFLHEMEMPEIMGCLGAPLISSINLTHATLPAMLERNEGHIVFIQSPVILQPWRSCTAYSVSRWGMHGLSESLRADLYNTNIAVSEIVFGRTETNYFKTNENADTRFPKIGKIITKITPEEAAYSVLRTIEKRKKYEYYPFSMKMVAYFNFYFPSIVRFLTHTLN